MHHKKSNDCEAQFEFNIYPRGPKNIIIFFLFFFFLFFSFFFAKHAPLGESNYVPFVKRGRKNGGAAISTEELSSKLYESPAGSMTFLT